MEAFPINNDEFDFSFERELHDADFQGFSDNLFPYYREDQFELKLCKEPISNFEDTNYTQESEYDQVLEFVSSPLRKPSGTKSMLNVLDKVPCTKKNDLKSKKKDKNKKVLSSKKSIESSSFTTNSSSQSSCSGMLEQESSINNGAKFSTFPSSDLQHKSKGSLDLSFLKESKRVTQINTKDIFNVFSSVQEWINTSKATNSYILDVTEDLSETFNDLREEFQATQIKRKYVRRKPYKKPTGINN